MSQYDKLLEELEAYSRSADGAKPVILMQHIAEQLHEAKTRYNWVGFYLMEAPTFDALVLGPMPAALCPRCAFRSTKDCAELRPLPGRP